MKTPTSSQYPVLENKPIDQWKVTELKEELKRRKLKTGGLKDELIRRLDEALRAEEEVANVEPANDNANGLYETALENTVYAQVDVTEQPVVEAGDLGAVFPGKAEETIGNADEAVGYINENVENIDASVVPLQMDVKDIGNTLGDDAKFDGEQSGLVNDSVLGEGMITATDVPPVVLGDEVSDLKQSGLYGPVLESGIVNATDVASVNAKVSIEQKPDLVDDSVLGDRVVTSTVVVSDVVGEEVIKGFMSEEAVGKDGLVGGKIGGDIRNSVQQEHSEDVKPAHEDVKLDSSDQNNQVSEVNSSLGFPVNYNNSVSTDSISIIEKNDVKDNLIADNVKLESDVKPEMMLPSSSELVPDGGKSHPKDVDEPLQNMVSVEDTDNTVANEDVSQKNFSANLGSAEQLHLDRSSGDDSMEEDALESNKIDSNIKSEDVGEKNKETEGTTVQGKTPVATSMDSDLPVEKKVIHDLKNDAATLSDKRKLSEKKVIHDLKNDAATLSDKRKLSDQEAAVNNKPAKRQHRWKKESNFVEEPQILHIPPVSTQNVPQSSALKRSFSYSVIAEPPKEREVPPSAKPATNSLRIDHFLRPFTLKAVQELLGKSGTVASFWMDHIKTHCYVTYSSIEEAVETRNAVYNLQWPPNGGRHLVAEFVEPEEVKLRLDPPPRTSAPTKGPDVTTTSLASPRLSHKQQPTLPPPPPSQNQVPVRERLLPPLPPIEKIDAPIVTLDDLFRKTKATPRIYYLPWTDEQVAARQKNPKP